MKFLLLTLALLFNFQPSDEMPERGTMADLQGLQKVYVATDDDDAYQMISKTLKGYKALEIVNSPKNADFILEYKVLTRDVAAGRGGADLAKRSQLRAVLRRDAARVVAWSESETLDVNDGFTMSRPNEINLTLNFIKAHKKAFAVKKKSD
jgi:hypothetical protein